MLHSPVSKQAMKIKRTLFIFWIIRIMEMDKFAQKLNFLFKGPETTLWTLKQHLSSPKRKQIYGNALIFFFIIFFLFLTKKMVRLTFLCIFNILQCSVCNPDSWLKKGWNRFKERHAIWFCRCACAYFCRLPLKSYSRV